MTGGLTIGWMGNTSSCPTGPILHRNINTHKNVFREIGQGRRRNLNRDVAKVSARLDENPETESESESTPYAGLSYVMAAEQQLKDEAAAKEALNFQPPKKTKRSKKSQGEGVGPGEIDEGEAARAAFHRRLFLAAKSGNTLEAETVIKEMVKANRPPGPKAFHGLVFSYAKSGSAEGALKAIRSAHSSGCQPISESYMVLIHAFVKEDNIKSAEAVVASMRRAGQDSRKGWLMLMSSLFREGKDDWFFYSLDCGRLENWKLTAELYAMIIQAYCRNGEVEKATQELESLLQDKVVCDTRHVNPLMEVAAESGDVPEISRLKNLIVHPDVVSYNALLKGYLKQWDDWGEDMSGQFMRTWFELNSTSAPNGTSLMLLIRAQMKTGNVRAAAKSLVGNRLGQLKGEGRKELLSELLPDLLEQLSTEGYPIDILQIIQSLSLEHMSLPSESYKRNENGCTFISSWIGRRISQLQSGQAVRSSTFGDATVATGSQIRELDGILIGFCNCAVEEDGTIITPSRLSVLQMRAELKARGLSIDGVRRELYERIQAARRAWPVIRDEVKRRQRLRMQQSRKERKAKQEKSAGILSDSKFDEEDEYVVVEYTNNKVATKQVVGEEELSAGLGLMDSGQPGDESDAEDGTLGEDSEDAVVMGDSEELGQGGEFDAMPFDDEDDEDDLQKIDEGPSEEVWLDSEDLDSKLTSKKSFTNRTAGALTAIGICEIVQEMGGVPTLEDVELIVMAIQAEGDPASAMAISKIFGPQDLLSNLDESEDIEESDKERLYNERVFRVFDSCARLCLDKGYPDSASQILTRMEERSLSPDPELQTAIEDAQKAKQSSGTPPPTQKSTRIPAEKMIVDDTDDSHVIPKMRGMDNDYEDLDLPDGVTLESSTAVPSTEDDVVDVGTDVGVDVDDMPPLDDMDEI